MPNIVWIYCDELRSDAVGCHDGGGMRVHTPHLDGLRAAGTRFAECFCNSPICVPSRVSTMTGTYPETNGCYGNEGAWRHYRLREDLTTLPQVFAAAGYQTANFGKSHLPANLTPWQLHEGAGGNMGDLSDHVPPPVPDNALGGPFPADRPYLPELVTENGLRWLRGRKGPWLARFSYLQPHTPLLPRPPYDRMYQDIRWQDAPEEAKRQSATDRLWSELWRERGYTGEQLRQARAYYMGLVGWVDEQVGRIVDALRSAGQLEDTIVVFSSDHGTSKGESWCGEKHIYAPWVHRVPLVVAWPGGGVSAGAVRRDPVQNLDLAPTLCAMAGIATPAQFEGHSVFAQSRPEAVYSTIGFGFPDSRAAPNGGMGVYYGGRGWPRRTCVRTTRFRYEKSVRLDGRRPTAADEDRFLADREVDGEELWNRADDPPYADTVRRLDALLEDHVSDAYEVPWEMVRRDRR